MKKLKLTAEKREQFLQALADSGSVTAAVATAGTSRTRVYELRKTDAAFAAAWDEAEEIAIDRLKDEARRRAIEGVAEPLVSAGKLVRGDDDQPIMVQRYSDNLLLALLKARRLRGATGPHACTYRHFDSQLMQPALWQRLPRRASGCSALPLSSLPTTRPKSPSTLLTPR